MGEHGPVRVPKEGLDELESVRRYTRAEILDMSTLRYLAERQASLR